MFRVKSRIPRQSAAGVLMASAILAATATNAAEQSAADSDAPATAAPLFFVNSNRISYEHIFNARDPGYYRQRLNGSYDGKIRMNAVSFTHFDMWSHGSNFFHVGWFKSSDNDPAAPCTNAGVIQSSTSTTPADCAGATDIYGLFRSTLGLNELFSTDAFSFGPVRNVSLEVGADFDSQNTYYSSSKRSFVLGLQFAMALPYQGYLNISPLYFKDAGHNGFTQCGSLFANPANCNRDGDTHFSGTWAVETNYSMELGFLPEKLRHFSISGRAGWYGEKGNFQGLAANESTKVEFNSEPIRLTFDLGRAMSSKAQAHALDVWVAYRYWQNMYGDNHNSAPYVCTVNGVSTHSCTMSSLAAGVSAMF